MSAQLQRPVRSLFANGNLARATPDEFAAAGSSYIAYWGRFFIDEDENTLSTKWRCADVAQFTSEAMESVPSSCGRRRRDRGPLCRTGNGGDWNRHHRTQQPALSARAVPSIAIRLSRACSPVRSRYFGGARDRKVVRQSCAPCWPDARASARRNWTRSVESRMAALAPLPATLHSRRVVASGRAVQNGRKVPCASEKTQ
jgi:Lipocalin-like domain